MTQKILIVGATSTIARATAHAFAKKGCTLYLAGRNEAELQRVGSDIALRHETTVFTGKADLQTILNSMGEIEGLVYAVGTMEGSLQEILSTNFNDAVETLEVFANYFEKQQKGFLIGISSVAGDRGRQSNYIYGAAKGGFSIYLQGLRHRLAKKNVRVMTIKPGFIDTPMTFGLPGLFLVASPEAIGKKIANMLNENADVIYFPWFWKYIMFVIRNIPEVFFKRTSL
jgi:decaprenylphospho-beta-D-erythro-pentofuranosid-2-ulose 2-reductase